MNLFTVNTDLLNNNLKLDVICHQINCCTTRAGGIAYSINKKYPYADRYTNRNVRDIPGEVYIQIPDDIKNPVVACLAGQISPGGSDNVETSKFRETLFQKCLDKFLSWLNDKSPLKIGFPYKIGCGLAGGDWDNYYTMICEFCKLLPQHTFYICKIE